MEGFGKFLMACGVMLGVYAYLIDPVVTRSIVESFADEYGPRVADPAALNDKTNLMIAAAALFLGGCRFVSVSSVRASASQAPAADARP